MPVVPALGFHSNTSHTFLPKCSYLEFRAWGVGSWLKLCRAVHPGTPQNLLQRAGRAAGRTMSRAMLILFATLGGSYRGMQAMREEGRAGPGSAGASEEKLGGGALAAWPGWPTQVIL